MYSGCGYPHKSCSCTFRPCHPYFILQFYSITFYTCYCSFLVPSGQSRQSAMAWFAHSIFNFIVNKLNLHYLYFHFVSVYPMNIVLIYVCEPMRVHNILLILFMDTASKGWPKCTHASHED